MIDASGLRTVFSGVDDFQGETLHTGHWPHADRFSGVLEPLEGKRVALIGNGSSGIQSIPEIAKVASELVVFSRTPQYSVPAQNQPLDKDYEAFMKANYKERRALMRANPGGQILHSNNEAVRERLRLTRTPSPSPNTAAHVQTLFSSYSWPERDQATEPARSVSRECQQQ